MVCIPGYIAYKNLFIVVIHFLIYVFVAKVNEWRYQNRIPLIQQSLKFKTIASLFPTVSLIED